MTARRALNPRDNGITSDQNWPKQMFFHKVAARMWLGIQALPTCRVQIHLSPHAASTYGIAPARHARPWIPYGPSEQSRWAPQLGQGSWQACMSIIVCPHMGHSLLLPVAIHHAQGSVSYYSFWQARRLRQRLSRYPDGRGSWLARPRL